MSKIKIMLTLQGAKWAHYHKGKNGDFSSFLVDIDLFINTVVLIRDSSE